MTIETIYDQIGGMGRFQVMTSLLIALCMVPAGWSLLQMSFAGVMPDFYCLVSDGTDGKINTQRNNFSTADIGISTFYPNETFNECSVNGTVCDAYLYYNSPQTVIIEWGLVCDLKWVKKVIISIQMAGVFLGAAVSGQFSDVFGRKKVMYSFASIHFVLNIIAGFSINWEMFAVMRFFLGLCVGAMIVVLVPFQMEFLPVKWRPLLGVIPSFTLGLSIFAGTAALLENWAYLHFACALVCLISLIGWFFVPESPRWLAVRGRTKEAKDVISQMAKMNNRPLPEDTMSILVSLAAEHDKSTETMRKYTYLDLFKTKFTAKISLAFFFYWFILAVVYYGIAFGVGSFVGNLYLNIFLLSVMEIPVQTTTFCLNNKVGRRTTTLLFLILCFISLLGCLIFNELYEGYTEDVATNVLSLIAKMMIGAAWSSIHVWGTELFPTVIRNLGSGFSTLGARVGGILAPFLIDLDDMMTQSYIILCVLLALGIAVAFLVPDTKGKVLEDLADVKTNNTMTVDFKEKRQIVDRLRDDDGTNHTDQDTDDNGDILIKEKKTFIGGQGNDNCKEC